METSIPVYNSQQDKNKYKIFQKVSLRKNFTLYSNTNKTNLNKSDTVAKQTNETNSATKKFPKIIAGTAILTGVGGVMLSRGFQKNAIKYSNKLKDYLERKLEFANADKHSKLAKFYKYTIHKTNAFIQKSESINNITSLKDILFMKLMYKTKPTKRVHKSISDWFEGLSRKTVTSSYKKTKSNFEKMYETFDRLDEYILKEFPDELIEFGGKMQTKQELVKQAKNYRETVKTVVDVFVSNSTQQSRYEYIKNATSTLYSRFWEASFKGFWTKNNQFKRKEMWQTFIAAEQVKADKTILEENVAIMRNVLSYNTEDKNKLISDYIKKLYETTPANDIGGIDITKKLLWFTKIPDGLKNYREIFEKELERLNQHILSAQTDKNIAEVYEKSKATYISFVKDILNDSGTGEIQDMLAIYYKIAPYELSKSGAEQAVKKAVKSFDKSVNLENTEFFDKLRDLELGSAPTDVLTILFSCLMISFGMNYAKNKNERISVMLKSGIPILGAIATSLISASRLVSGGKSLALGFVSGLILNKIGSSADKLRHSFQKS